MFLTFWLRNVLRATTACTFSTSQLPKVVRTWCVLYIFTWKCASRHNGARFFNISTSKKGPNLSVLYILTWKCASRHNGVHIFISHLASCLRTRRFSEPTFRPSRATNHWKKHSVSRLFYLFAHLPFLSSESFSSLIFSLLIFLFSLPLPCSAFHLSILSEVWLLNFLRSDKMTNRMPDKLSDCLSKYTPDTGGDHSKEKNGKNKSDVSALILPLSPCQFHVLVLFLLSPTCQVRVSRF